MGETTGISWTDSTFNSWWGCTKVSPGCDRCYAETFDHRLGGKHWGKDAPRRVFGQKHWNEPIKWNRAAEASGKRRKVFCASMADVFDADAPEGQLERLWALIRETPWLDWQLLTKRAGRIARSLPPDWGNGYPNVWLGVTAENQEQLIARLKPLLEVPARVKWISAEPLIAPLDPYFFELAAVDWIIVGGESGHGARPFDLQWARTLIKWGREIGTAIFLKQLGARVEDNGTAIHVSGKGDDPAAWTPDLRVREFPRITNEGEAANA